MSSGPMHQYQVDLCIELAEPPLRAFLERNLEYARLGSGWHDAMAPPAGVADRATVAEYWGKRNAPFARQLVEWGLADETPCVRKHFIYGPDWYVRQMHRAMREGNEAKAAVLWGILLHSCEYLTASKSSGMIVHDLPEDVTWAERWLVNGHPFQDEFAYYKSGTKEFDHDKNVRRLREKLDARTDMSCCALYNEMLRRHYESFFRDELQWVIDCEERGPLDVHDRYEDLCYEEQAGTLGLGLAALRDVVSGRTQAPASADILFLIREDLWRRALLEAKREPRRKMIEGLRYVSAAVKLGLSFDLWSGEGRPDLTPYRAVVALCGEPLGDEAEFAEAMRTCDRSIVVSHGAADPLGFEPFFESLRRIFGKEKVPAESHWTDEDIVASFRRLNALRRDRLSCTACHAHAGVGVPPPEARPFKTVDLTEMRSGDSLRCIRWDGSEDPDPASFLDVAMESSRWEIKAPTHGTLHLRKQVSLPAARQIILKFSVRVERSIAVGMSVRCACAGAERELMRMHVANAEPRDLAFDLTPFAGREFHLHFAWDAGYDFGYEDRDTLVVERPEILCFT